MTNILPLSNENLRLEQLYNLEILDSSFEQDFDDIVQLASQICKVPISLISLLDAKRQCFKAKIGIQDLESPKETSFCKHVIYGDDHMEVTDTLLDERFRNNPSVIKEPKIRFYAGYPLEIGGFKIGTLCVLDTVPRKLNDEQNFALKVLSGQIMKLLELRLRNKETEMRIKESEKQQLHLEELTQSQSQIISYIAHDVRNPLASLKGIIEMNNMQMLTPLQIDDVMGMLNKQLVGTLDLLTNLIEWGQAQVHRKIPHTRPVNLYEVVKRKFRNFEIAAQVKGNTLHNEVTQDFMVMADEYMLRFILRNLVGNSNKFTSNGTVSITATTDGKNALITVTDNGVGISKKVMEKLFLPNVRSTTPGTNNEKGSGLGLALAKEFIEKLGSSLVIESEQGKGTAFSFSLPIAI